MILHHVKAQTLRRFLLGNSRSKRHFQNNLYVCLVTCFYHIFQLAHSTSVRRICLLRRKIKRRTISPIINLCFCTLIKLINRHALDLVHPKFFQIRNLFDHPLIRSSMQHFWGTVLCKAPHMDTVWNYFIPWMPNRAIFAPIIIWNLYFRPYAMFIIVLPFSKYFPSCNFFCVWICTYLSIDQKVIFVFFRINFFYT